MNDVWGDESNSMPEADETTPKGLRDWANSVRDQNKELLARLDAMDKERKQEKVQVVFEKEGLIGAMEHYKGETDPEKAKAWIESMKGVFGGVAPTPVQTPQAQGIPPEQLTQYQQITEAGANATPLTAEELAIASVKSADSFEELAAQMTKYMQ